MLEKNIDYESIVGLEELILNRLSWRIPIFSPFEFCINILQACYPSFIFENTFYGANYGKEMQLFQTSIKLINFSFNEFSIYRKFSEFIIILSCIFYSLKQNQEDLIINNLGKYFSEDLVMINDCNGLIDANITEKGYNSNFFQDNHKDIKDVYYIDSMCLYLNHENNFSGLKVNTQEQTQVNMIYKQEISNKQMEYSQSNLFIEEKYHNKQLIFPQLIIKDETKEMGNLNKKLVKYNSGQKYMYHTEKENVNYSNIEADDNFIDGNVSLSVQKNIFNSSYLESNRLQKYFDCFNNDHLDDSLKNNHKRNYEQQPQYQEDYNLKSIADYSKLRKENNNNPIMFDHNNILEKDYLCKLNFNLKKNITRKKNETKHKTQNK